MKYVSGMSMTPVGVDILELDNICMRTMGCSIMPYEFLIDYYQMKFFEKLNKEKEHKSNKK